MTRCVVFFKTLRVACRKEQMIFLTFVLMFHTLAACETGHVSLGFQVYQRKISKDSCQYFFIYSVYCSNVVFRKSLYQINLAKIRISPRTNEKYCFQISPKWYYLINNIFKVLRKAIAPMLLRHPLTSLYSRDKSLKTCHLLKYISSLTSQSSILVFIVLSKNLLNLIMNILLFISSK